ncbi:hypothetical protein PENTCL1PPCAC_3458, partial [Pristionchus entomophagus]
NTSIQLSTIAATMERQGEGMENIEKEVAYISENMIRKLPIKYDRMSEKEVSELDVEKESPAVFAGKLAVKLFSEEEQFELVEDRDQHVYRWIVDLVWRRRSGTEKNSTKENVQSRIRAHIDQKAKRDCAKNGM